MAAEPQSPIVYDLTKQPLPALVDLNQTKDSDGYYFRAGDLVAIDADQKVKKATTSTRGFGILQTSIHEHQAPDGLDARHKVAVLTQYKYVVRMTAKGAVSAGNDVVADTTDAGKVKAATTFAVTVNSGGTTVTSSAANGAITTAAGSTLPQEIIGKCWKGGTDTEILVLI